MAGAYSKENWEQLDRFQAQKDKAALEAAKAAAGPTHLENKQYARLMTDYLKCTQMFVNSFVYPAVMEQ